MTATKRMERLSGELAAWRRTHRAPSPIPQELWGQAVDLAVEQGIYGTARALHLDYGALKKRVEARESPCSAPPATTIQQSATFYELLSPLSSSIPECEMEVYSPRGGTLRVAMRNVPPSTLSSILREFVG